MRLQVAAMLIVRIAAKPMIMFLHFDHIAGHKLSLLEEVRTPRVS